MRHLGRVFRDIGLRQGLNNGRLRWVRLVPLKYWCPIKHGWAFLGCQVPEDSPLVGMPGRPEARARPSPLRMMRYAT